MAAEEILFMSEYVRFKKNNGKLKLLSDKIIWIGDEAEKPRLCFAYSHIKGKVTKLKLMCYNDIVMRS